MSKPVRYNISSWDQLPQCLSNTSIYLSLSVKYVRDRDKLVGTLIEVNHSLYGSLFTYLIHCSGSLIPNNDVDYELNRNAILKQLERFGFFITFDIRQGLAADQLKFLRTVRQLHFDKLRILPVQPSTDSDLAANHVVVFNVEQNSKWLDNTYVATYREYAQALVEGSAMDLNGVTATQKYSWDWLDFVADIDDILSDNVGGELT